MTKIRAHLIFSALFTIL